MKRHFVLELCKLFEIIVLVNIVIGKFLKIHERLVEDLSININDLQQEETTNDYFYSLKYPLSLFAQYTEEEGENFY